MNKNIRLLSLFLFLFSSCNFSKDDDEKTIKDLFNQYSAAVISEDYETMYQFKYPEVFKNYTKEQIISDLKDGVHSPDYDIIINSMTIDPGYKVTIHDSGKYSLININSKSSLNLKSSKTGDSTILFNKFCEGSKKYFGENNVECNKSGFRIEISSKTENWFIYDSKSKKWYLLSATNPEGIDTFIPKEVRQVFGK